MTLCAAATLLIAAAVQPATADDTSVCFQATGDEAIAACTRVLAYNPNDVGAYVMRATAYGRKGEYDRAISDYDQAIRLEPAADAEGGGLIYAARGGFYSLKGDYDRAIADYDRSIRLDPKVARAYRLRGIAFKHKGDYDHAIADANEAIRLDPKFAVAYVTRGEAYEAKNDPDHALADFDHALKLDPSLASARQGRERMQVLLARRSNPGTETNAPPR